MTELEQKRHELDEFKRTHPFTVFAPHRSQERTQFRFIHEDLKRSWIFGGNQSGKTTAVAYRFLRLAKRYGGQRWWLCSPSFELSREGLQKKVWDMLDIEDRRINSYTETDGFKNDTVVVRVPSGGWTTGVFKSYEQGREKFGSATLDGVVFDEECPWDIYQECIARVGARDGYLIGAMTALRYKTRLVNMIYFTPESSTGIRCYRMSTYENHIKYGGVYSDAKLKEFELSYDPRDLPARMHGIPTLKTGLVYDIFEDNWPWVLPSAQEFTIPPWWAGYEAIDPHPRVPNAVLFGAVEPNGRLWIYDYIKSTGTPKEIYPQIMEKRVRSNGRIVEPEVMRMDAHGGTAYVDVMEKRTFHNVWCDAGMSPVLCHCPVDVRIPEVRRYMKVNMTLKTPKVIIFERCQPIIQEILGYVWDSFESDKTEDRSEIKQTPLKKNDHYINCLEYIIGAGCDYQRPAGQIAHSMRINPQRLRQPEETVGFETYAT